MKRQKKKSGFTLLEIIIVIIIVGTLASLALPKFYSVVEFSKSLEAYLALGTLRGAVERYYVASAGTYAGCAIGALDVEDPSISAGARFSYALSGLNATQYVITATRKTIDGGDGTSTVVFTSNLGQITRTGTGKFIGIK